MGFSDEDFYKVKNANISDSQLYKMAGNSIVVNVLMAIFKNLFKTGGSKMKKLNKSDNGLKRRLKKNTTLVHREGREEHTEREGEQIDSSSKHNIQKQTGVKTVGMSFGLTKNMGDFESLRVDAWLTDEVKEGETQEQALQRISDLLQTHLVETVSDFTDEN
jgi:ribose 5-phosphate isomerase RpiB